MNIYNIKTNFATTYCVVAESMAEAERIFLGKYPTIDMRAIELVSRFVQIQKYDEQKKET